MILSFLLGFYFCGFLIGILITLTGVMLFQRRGFEIPKLKLSHYLVIIVWPILIWIAFAHASESDDMFQ